MEIDATVRRDAQECVGQKLGEASDHDNLGTKRGQCLGVSSALVLPANDLLSSLIRSDLIMFGNPESQDLEPVRGA